MAKKKSKRRAKFKLIHGDRSASEPTVNVMAVLKRAGFTVIEGGSKD